MSPISIKPVSNLNLETKFGSLSQYAKNFIKLQVKSIAFEMERFFTEFDAKLISEHESELKEIGFKEIGKNFKEGLLISGSDYDYHIFSEGVNTLNFNLINRETNEICRHFSVNTAAEKFRYAGNFSGLNVEDELSKILDFVDNRMYLAKKEYTPAGTMKPFLPDETTSKKIEKVNKILHTKTDTKQAISGYIDQKDEELIDTIIEKFNFTQELYKKIKDIRTKYEVKKSYKNYLPESVANKIGFRDIGPNGENISLYKTSVRNNAYSTISVTNSNGENVKFVISKDKRTVQKNLPTESVKSGNYDYRIYTTPVYYSQKEIDNSNLKTYLSCLDKAMDSFIKHTQNWFDKKEERELICSNYDSATLDNYKELLDDVYSNFEKYQKKMRKYLRKPHKSRKFKAENNISTKVTTTAVKFDNITPDGYDLRLSFPKVKDDTATQLLVMQGDEIKNSFYILNNKLLRFNIKDLNFRFNRYNQNLYYYDNKHLQNSELPNYLSLINNKLQELNTKLDILREQQIANRRNNRSIK